MWAKYRGHVEPVFNDPRTQDVAVTKNFKSLDFAEPKIVKKSPSETNLTEPKEESVVRKIFRESRNSLPQKT